MTKLDDTVPAGVAAAIGRLPEAFAGFGDVYVGTIWPALRGAEAARVKAEAAARDAMWLGLKISAGMLAVVALVGALFSGMTPLVQAGVMALGVGVVACQIVSNSLGGFAAKYILPFVTMGCFIGGGFWSFQYVPIGFLVWMFSTISAMMGLGVSEMGKKDLKAILRQAKLDILEPIASHLGLSYKQKIGRVPSIRMFKKIRLAPQEWDISSYTDQMTGAYRSVDFEFFEALLKTEHESTDSDGRTTKSYVTVFEGQCLRADFHKRFMGETRLVRTRDISKRRDKALKRLRLDTQAFDDAFAVYSSDEVESRFILTPDLMVRLIELDQAFEGADLRCVFRKGELFITLNHADMLEAGDMYVALDDPSRMARILDEFASILAVVDAVSALPEERIIA